MSMESLHPLSPASLSRASCGGVLLTLALVSHSPLVAQRDGPKDAAFTAGIAPDSLQSIVIHPVISLPFTCMEHAFHPGDPVILGDAAGVDCLAVLYDDASHKPRNPPRLFRGDGMRNEDWVGWKAEVLAAFDGVVEEVMPNAVVNRPGIPGEPPAGFLVFRRADGTRVTYGHVQGMLVKGGDSVRAGQVIGVVGNNGFAYMPHTHIGAWRDGRPLQIRIDLVAAGKQEMARWEAEQGKGKP